MTSFLKKSCNRKGCSVTQGRKRKARHDSSHPSKDAPHAANSPIFEQQQGRQSHQSHVSAHRQKSQKFIAGGDRRSVSGSDGRCFAAFHINNLVASMCIRRHTT